MLGYVLRVQIDGGAGLKFSMLLLPVPPLLPSWLRRADGRARARGDVVARIPPSRRLTLCPPNILGALVALCSGDKAGRREPEPWPGGAGGRELLEQGPPGHPPRSPASPALSPPPRWQCQLCGDVPISPSCSPRADGHQQGLRGHLAQHQGRARAWHRGHRPASAAPGPAAAAAAVAGAARVPPGPAVSLRAASHLLYYFSI